MDKPCRKSSILLFDEWHIEQCFKARCVDYTKKSTARNHVLSIPSISCAGILLSSMSHSELRLANLLSRTSSHAMPYVGATKHDFDVESQKAIFQCHQAPSLISCNLNSSSDKSHHRALLHYLSDYYAEAYVTSSQHAATHVTTMEKFWSRKIRNCDFCHDHRI